MISNSIQSRRRSAYKILLETKRGRASHGLLVQEDQDVRDQELEEQAGQHRVLGFKDLEG